MPVHPEAQTLLDALAEQGMPPIECMTVPQAREACAAFIDLQPPPEDVADVTDRTIPGPAGDIPVRIYTPAGAGPRGVLVYFHGGGWVIGDLETVDRPCRTFANAADVVVVSVDYRLAPEHVQPAAFDDCYAATVWVAEHADELGVDPTRLAVGGDSAGGHLAAAVSLAARDRRGPEIAFQMLLYPVVDFDWTSPSITDNGEGYLLGRATMQWFWAHYLGATDPGDDPIAFPLRAGDVSGLPPAFVGTAEYDPLRDEGEAYARKLEAAGTTVTATRYDGMIHGFLWTLGATPSGTRMVDDAVAALRPALRSTAAAA
ncbi:alpha/beta hydrolase [Actinomycetospora cinnamomea]|uniref:Acetyl esterase n=1 Tax=Actinomycetospora cinnamomea TaxID=663609 RepID=A0A2U1F708_9PSEU|nr:alpha/beta hydrolase [Actinomycetospora cinnamomea]PVZ07954.1 acetyl esterase [Actinomycetospora cinnamomea]